MKSFFAFLIPFVLAFPLRASGTGQMKYSVDLRKVNDDQVLVQLETPHFSEEFVIFRFPRIVPGTYKIYDFGRFISEFQPYDQNGEPLQFTRIDTNSFEISAAPSLRLIEYKVADTWDHHDIGKAVFEPAGSNIEEKQNFVINHHSFFGYFEGFESLELEMTFYKPSDFYGSTSLERIQAEKEKEVFISSSYQDLVDAPVMFCKPDTSIIMIGETEVSVSVYAPGNSITSAEVARDIKDVLLAQQKYLGGELPVTRYAFIFYFSENLNPYVGFGALEHNYCSFYYLPEMIPAFISPIIREIAAHEFFHILTPLNLHSEEIHQFDFNDPKMSKHLWMYEGVTEYFAGHVLVTEGLMDDQQFLDWIRMKIIESQSFNDSLSFTAMSKGCLDQYEDQYYNVYQKGALIGLCMDLLIRQSTQNEKSLRDMMLMLAGNFGKQQPFKDEELFSLIGEWGGPVLKEFIDKHVEGDEPIPYEEIFSIAGLEYDKEKWTTTHLPYGLYLNEADDGRLIAGVDPYAGLMPWDIINGDEILKFNGQKVSESNYEELLEELDEKIEEGDTFTILVRRKGEKKKVQADWLRIPESNAYYLNWMGSPSDEQLTNQKAWLKQ